MSKTKTKDETVETIEAVMQGKIIQRAELLAVATPIYTEMLKSTEASSSAQEVADASVMYAQILINEVNKQFVD